jgi:hypothetical protein
MAQQKRHVVWSDNPIVANAIMGWLQQAGQIIVERSRIEEIFREQQFVLTHTPDDEATLLKIGKLAGADWVVFAESTVKQANSFYSFSQPAFMVSVTLRSVNVETGEVRFVGTAAYQSPVLDPDPSLDFATRAAMTRALCRTEHGYKWETPGPGGIGGCKKQEGNFDTGQPEGAQTSKTAQRRITPPVVIAAGSLDSATIDHYFPFAVLFRDARGIPDSGARLEESVVSFFLTLGVPVVEGGQLKQLFKEDQIQTQSADETAQVIKAGKLAGAKAVVLGTIGEWKEETIETSVSSVSLKLKIIDVETGTILFSGQGSYDYSVAAPAKVVAQALLSNIHAHFLSSLGMRGARGFNWKITEREDQRTAVITKIFPGSPAEQADLRIGDELLSCKDNSTLNLKSQWQSMKDCETEPGQPITLQIVRSGATRSVKITPVDRIQFIKDMTTAR